MSHIVSNAKVTLLCEQNDIKLDEKPYKETAYTGDV